jgi:hypothetical protein
MSQDLVNRGSPIAEKEATVLKCCQGPQSRSVLPLPPSQRRQGRETREGSTLGDRWTSRGSWAGERLSDLGIPRSRRPNELHDWKPRRRMPTATQVVKSGDEKLVRAGP